jgi:hypothetical protein
MKNEKKKKNEKRKQDRNEERVEVESWEYGNNRIFTKNVQIRSKWKGTKKSGRESIRF